MKPDEIDPMANINAGIEELKASMAAQVQRNLEAMAASSRMVPSGDNPYGDDLVVKAKAIVRALDGQVEFQMTHEDDAIKWRSISNPMRSRRFSIEAFLEPNFTDLDIANEFNIQPRRRRGLSPAQRETLMKNLETPLEFDAAAVSGNSQRDAYDEVKAKAVAEGIAKMASVMGMTQEESKKIAEKIRKLADSAEYAASTVADLGRMMPAPDDEKLVRARAEAALDAIVMDIQANILIGDDAVRESASEWLTLVTARITEVINNLEAGRE